MGLLRSGFGFLFHFDSFALLLIFLFFLAIRFILFSCLICFLRFSFFIFFRFNFFSFIEWYPDPRNIVLSLSGLHNSNSTRAEDGEYPIAWHFAIEIEVIQSITILLLLSLVHCLPKFKWLVFFTGILNPKQLLELILYLLLLHLANLEFKVVSCEHKHILVLLHLGVQQTVVQDGVGGVIC